jgi:hypothetical protein
VSGYKGPLRAESTRALQEKLTPGTKLEYKNGEDDLEMNKKVKSMNQIG